MPTYAFACTECGQSFEKQLPIQDSQTTVTCPEGHRAVRRVYSAPRVVFKGNGWYSTDHSAKPSPATTE
jgi:putative FmdB family regulatory protein